MLAEGLKTGKGTLIYGNKSSCCWFCAEERMQENRKAKKRTGINHDTAAQELAGKFTTKPMFRFPIAGGPYLICLDHMKQFVNDMTKLEQPKGYNDDTTC